MWIDGPSLPDSAIGQNVTFEGCLAVLNLSEQMPFSEQEKMGEAIASAYASNHLVFFLFDDDTSFQSFPDWVDLLECSFAMAPLSVVVRPSPHEMPLKAKIATLKQLGERIWEYDKVKLLKRQFSVVGYVIDPMGKKIFLPFTEVDLSDGNSKN